MWISFMLCWRVRRYMASKMPAVGAATYRPAHAGNQPIMEPARCGRHGKCTARSLPRRNEKCVKVILSSA